MRGQAMTNENIQPNPLQPGFTYQVSPGTYKFSYFINGVEKQSMDNYASYEAAKTMMRYMCWSEESFVAFYGRKYP